MMQGLDSASKIMKKIIPNFRKNDLFFPICLLKYSYKDLYYLVSNSSLLVGTVRQQHGSLLNCLYG